MLKTSNNIYEDVFNIQTSYLLNVSPFILNLVTQYVKDSERDNLASTYNLFERNRAIAKKVLRGSLLEIKESNMKVSVAWFEITDPHVTATKLQRAIHKEGVYVLPGTYFYWHDQSRGERFIRLALARNTSMFKPAIFKVRKALDKYAKTL